MQIEKDEPPMFVSIFMRLAADLENNGVSGVEINVDGKSFNLIGERMQGLLWHGNPEDYKLGRGYNTNNCQPVKLDNLKDIKQMHCSFIVINRK